MYVRKTPNNQRTAIGARSVQLFQRQCAAVANQSILNDAACLRFQAEPFRTRKLCTSTCAHTYICTCIGGIQSTVCNPILTSIILPQTERNTYINIHMYILNFHMLTSWNRRQRTLAQNSRKSSHSFALITIFIAKCFESPFRVLPLLLLLTLVKMQLQKEKHTHTCNNTDIFSHFISWVVL